MKQYTSRASFVTLTQLPWRSCSSSFRDLGKVLCSFALAFSAGMSASWPPAYAAENSEECQQSEEVSWVDSSHCYLSAGADNVAQWMNDFFGDVRTEVEAPYSIVRVALEEQWDEIDKFDTDVRFRGNIYLPKLNKRLSLLFSDEDTGATGNDDLFIDNRDNKNNIALQYRVSEKKHSRFDFRVGLRSAVNMKTALRYRYEYPILETLIGRFSQELLYLGGDGFGTRTRLDFDKIISDDKLLRWHNRVDWKEDSSGVGWNSTLSWDRKLSPKKALSYFVSVNGETDPSFIKNYLIGVRYRQNFFRPWLFAEVQPGYRWTKPEPGMSIENAAVILFRLEVVFKSDRENQRKKKKKS